MLEDPSYSSVVRWGDDGDSFVVLENEKFTKSILPKHFKHSNFASFVRQLNKYDFHKVRQNNEDGAQSQYGPNAWEFKHPEFKANSKDSLDNIRRKAPAPRKPNAINEEQIPIQQIDLMNQQIVAQAQQIEILSASNNDLRAQHQNMVQELLRMHKTVYNHDRIMQDVMAFLHSVDAKQRRESKILFPGAGADGPTTTNLTPTSQNMAVPDDEPASPLQHAQKLMQEYEVNASLNFGTLDQVPNTLNGPTDVRNGQYRGPSSAGSSSSMGYSKLNNAELEHMVYPMGQNNGIDPMYSEHINNIPYPMPPKEFDVQDPRRQFADGRKKSTFADPGWTRQPRVLLVEDDPTCRQIGGKFLVSFQCSVEHAHDGLEAVSKIQDGGKYDLILMDIIMPNLDGVSACHIIRQFDRTPIVAMTSNIRSDDIQMYFQHGMDDVLPKPFTRKSLLDMLEKHLMHLKKLPAGMDPPPAAGLTTGTQSTAHSVRDDMSAAASPAGSTGTWNSPSQYSGVSPVNPNMNVPYGNVPNQPQYVDASSPYSASMAQQQRSMGQQPTHRRGPSDIGVQDMGANKRQRINPPYGQQMAAPMSGRQQ